MKFCLNSQSYSLTLHQTHFEKMLTIVLISLEWMRVSFYYIIFQTIYISLKMFYLDNFIIFNMFNKTFFSFGNGPWHILMLGISIWHDNFVVELSADYSKTWKRVCLYKKNICIQNRRIFSFRRVKFKKICSIFNSNNID